MSSKGEYLNNSVRAIIENKSLRKILGVQGHPVWSFLTIQDHEFIDSDTTKTLFMQVMMDRGILCLGSHLITYAHSYEDIDKMILAYDEFTDKLIEVINGMSIENILRCEPLRPLFKVRKD